MLPRIGRENFCGDFYFISEILADVLTLSAEWRLQSPIKKSISMILDVVRKKTRNVIIRITVSNINHSVTVASYLIPTEK